MIVDLGGVPSMQHKTLDFGRNGAKGYLRKLVSLEKGAIAMYKEHIKLIPDKEIKRTSRGIYRTA